MWLQRKKYEQVSTSELEDLEPVSLDSKLEEIQCSATKLARKRSLFHRACPWFAHFVLLVLSLCILLLASRVSEEKGIEKLLENSIWSPALPDVGVISEKIILNGTFDFPSIYRGTPTAEVDAAWKRITKVGPFSISRDDVIRMEKSAEECVQLPENLGGGYMGTVEVFHQLHCLDLIRKYTYLDYYKPKNPLFWGDPLIRMHLDHCIEMLRQNLMCTSDLNIITYKFVEFRPEAWPDFNTLHRCRNFDNVLEWYHKRELHTTRGGNTQITKTAGAFVVATPP